MFSPVFLFFSGFLIAGMIGLFCWNLRLHFLLRINRAAGERKEATPLPPVLPITEVRPLAPAEPAVSPPKETDAPRKAASNEAIWQERIAHADLQMQVVQQELAALSYSVSHDLRAPLRAIDGFSQALAEDYAHVLDTTAQGYLQRVRANTKLMASLIEDLLSLSRLARAPMHRDWLEVEPLVESIAAGLRKVVPDRAVTLEIQPRIRAFADRYLLEVVLRHLLSNAWKFTSHRPGANVSVRATVEKQDSGESEWVYEVRDNGAGFDMNYAGKLFGAFQRMHTSEEFPGNGIGLAAVQRIVRRHGGRVWAEAVPDQGTAIFFTLGTAVVLNDLPVVDFSTTALAEAAGPADAASFSVSKLPAL